MLQPPWHLGKAFVDLTLVLARGECGPERFDSWPRLKRHADRKAFCENAEGATKTTPRVDKFKLLSIITC